MGKARQTPGLALLFLLFFLPACIQVMGQSGPGSEDFFIAPQAETLMYSPDSISTGGGFTIGYGSGIAMGLRMLFAVDPHSYGIVEMLFFLRLYLAGSWANTGPFVQINGGPVLFTSETIRTVRKGIGTISAGISAGWRIPLGKYWFLEPAIRSGYPYIAGAGVSGGLRL